MIVIIGLCLIGVIVTYARAQERIIEQQENDDCR